MVESTTSSVEFRRLTIEPTDSILRSAAVNGAILFEDRARRRTTIEYGGFRMVEPTGPIARQEVRHDQQTIQQVSQAMVVASLAVRHGASDAQLQAENLARKLKDAMGRSVYSACYCLSYGVVFPTMFLAKLLPLDNAVGRGICDGATAACRSVDARLTRPAQDDATATGWSVVPAV